MIFTRKVNKFPEFYKIIARNIFPDFFLGGGAWRTRAPDSPSPTPMDRPKVESTPSQSACSQGQSGHDPLQNF